MKVISRLVDALATAFSLISISGVALAHSKAPHPNTLKAPQGGQPGIAGALSNELMIDKTPKMVWRVQ